MNKLGWLVIFVWCCGACTSRVTKQELQQYVLDSENGLLKKKTGNISFDVMYRPKDLIIAQEVGSEVGRWDEVAQSLDSLDYFMFKISRDNQEIENMYANDTGKFSQVVNYLNGGMAPDIFLQVGEEKIDVEDMIYSQTFGTANGSHMLVVFKSKLIAKDEDFSFVFDDTVLGTGRHQFDFQLSDIKDVPELKQAY